MRPSSSWQSAHASDVLFPAALAEVVLSAAGSPMMQQRVHLRLADCSRAVEKVASKQQLCERSSLCSRILG
uniref:Secreted protein n=1 Tax=Panagrellus redivivus TaxID=6233 RepID=A0A7E4V1W4_PANRE